MAVETLDRDLYSVGEAARLLRMPSQTLRRWLDGATRKGVFYEPVLRSEPTGKDVTWGEFVEAGLLREYRVRGVHLATLREFITDLREEFGAPYPLAHSRPFYSGRNLVMRAQTESGLADDLWVVRAGPDSGQYLLEPETERFLDKVEFDDEVARRLYPHGRAGLIEVDPQRSFGTPTVRGIRTENVFDLFQAGESVDVIAGTLDLETDAVEAAIRFEAAAA